MSITVDMTGLQASFLQLAVAINERFNENEANTDAETLGGMTKEQIIEAIVGQQGLTLGDVLDQLNAFIDRRDNPNEVTAEQVGLGLVENKGLLTTAEAMEVGLKTYEQLPGEAVSKYVDGPALAYALGNFWAQTVGASPEVLNDIHELSAAILANQDLIQTIQDNATNKVNINDFNSAISTLQTAIGDLTAADVGLGNLENLQAATLPEMQNVNPPRKYLTADVHKLFMDAYTQTQRAEITAEIDAAVSGLAMTAEDIGLDQVVNSGFATDVQARDSEVVEVYMDPARTHLVANDAIEAYNTDVIIPAFNALKTSIDEAITVVTGE